MNKMSEFPQVLTDNDVRKQVVKIAEECGEALLEEDGTDAFAEEAMDVIHSAATLERILMDELGWKRFMAVKSEVISKNIDRGYYV